MTCRYCRTQLAEVHGHLACVNNQCALFGVNQVSCCEGAELCPTEPVEVR